MTGDRGGFNVSEASEDAADTYVLSGKSKLLPLVRVLMWESASTQEVSNVLCHQNTLKIYLSSPLQLLTLVGRTLSQKIGRAVNSLHQFPIWISSTSQTGIPIGQSFGGKKVRHLQIVILFPLHLLSTRTISLRRKEVVAVQIDSVLLDELIKRFGSLHGLHLSLLGQTGIPPELRIGSIK